MADNDQDLVSQVKVEGIPETEAQLKGLGDTGAAAFEKIGTAAAASGAAVAAAGTEVAAGTAEIAAAAAKAKASANSLKELTQATSDLAREMKRGVKDVVEFGARTAKLGAIGLAAVTGIAVLARTVAKSADTSTDALKQQTDAQVEAVNQQAALASSTVQYDSQQRQLQRSLARGEISFESYSKTLQQNRDAFNEQIRVQRELDAIQQETKRRTDELQKQAADTAAYRKLIDTFGGPLTSSLINFGNQVEQTRKGLLQAFSPALASFIDAIGGAIQRNSATIDGFATRASAAITEFATKNGPAIDKAIKGIVEIVSFLVEGFAKAGPQILALINGVIVPAFAGLQAVLQGIADLVNGVFGTQINAAFLLGLVAVLKFTKAIQALFAALSLIRGAVVFVQALTVALTISGQAATITAGAVRLLTLAFGPWGIAIGLLIAALALLATQIDWPAFAQKVQDAIAGIITFFGNLGTIASQIAQEIEDDWNGVVQFFTAIPAQITQLFTDMWAGIVTLATTAVQGVTDAWNTTVAFFSGVIEQIKLVFANAWQSIVDTFNGAVSSIQNRITSLVATATSYLQPLIDLLNKALALSQAVAGDTASAPPGFAGGGHVGAGMVSGPGTSTSDSVLALLSRGEFVVKASRVRALGTGFLNALNSGVAGLRKLPGYAMGGLVGLGAVPVPAFAGGGSADIPVTSTANLRPMNLHIGTDVFEGLLAPEHVAQKLTIYATRKNSNKAGRTPGWQR